MIQFTSITLRADLKWVFDWTPTSATFYRVILYGMELDRLDTPPYLFSLAGWEDFPPPIEVVEEDEVSYTETYLPYLNVQWYAEDPDGVSMYVLRKLVGVEWIDRGFQMEDGFTWVYTIQSQLLEDETFHQFRLIAMDMLEQVSDPYLFQRYVITAPYFDPTTISVVYDDPDIVIDEV